MKRLLAPPIVFLFIVFFAQCKNQNHETSKNTVINRNWVGEWTRHIYDNEAGVSIKKIEGDSIEFEINASSGGNMGEVDGKAVLNGKAANYFSIENNDTCVLTFELCGDSLIIISQEKGMCYAGLGVVYTGKYYNNKYKPVNIEKDEDLVTLNILDSSENIRFKILVGKDYDLFVNSTQLTSLDDTADIDSLRAVVHASGVRGLYTQMENIIITDSSNDIWAAVIDDAGDEDKVYYYTTRKDYQHTLPKTIDKWRENFKEYPVVYKSAE